MSRLTYQTPSLSVFGRVDEIHKAFGNKNQQDTIFNSDGTVNGPDRGSIDGIIVPCNTAPPGTVCS